ncbi:MAG: GTPase [Clostridiales bacterium]|nr:GTPase [Candidatus Equinaster intestinalis]
MDIPVYLFTGFLESGKTKFIQETLTDKRFNNGERTLILLCEEGIEEYDPSEFSGEKVYIESIEKENLNEKNLEQLRKNCKAQRVIVEYNGMWQLQELFDALPDKWIIAQEFMFADAATFIGFNANMRSLVVDKLTTAELVVFNRYNDQIDKMELHKIVRGVNRTANIAYEKVSGEVEYDDIADPLPFDTDAPIIEIEDKDYALWYRDMTDELDKYNGKTVKFKGQAAKHRSLPKNCFVIGRPLMTCCVEDIQFAGLVCVYDRADIIENKQWLKITAKLVVENHKAYGQAGPVLHVTDVALTTPPENEVATFY